MDIIVGQRGSGRTCKLIEACAARKGSVIVCPTHHMTEYTYALAKKMGYEIEKPIAFDDFYQRKTQGKKVTGYFFDNLDQSLAIMAAGTSVCAATFELGTKSLNLTETIREI